MRPPMAAKFPADDYRPYHVSRAGSAGNVPRHLAPTDKLTVRWASYRRLSQIERAWLIESHSYDGTWATPGRPSTETGPYPRALRSRGSSQAVCIIGQPTRRFLHKRAVIFRAEAGKTPQADTQDRRR